MTPPRSDFDFVTYQSMKNIITSVGAAALVAALPSIAVATPTTPGVSPLVSGNRDRALHKSPLLTERHDEGENGLQAALPALVSGLAMRSPVHIAACDVLTPTPALNIGTGAVPMSESPYQLRIKFSNDGDQPITRVVVALNDGRTVVDVGTFTPGIMIDHTFDIAPGEADSCSIASASFADGTEWNAH
jgi:hypothetical protein